MGVTVIASADATANESTGSQATIDFDWPGNSSTGNCSVRIIWPCVERQLHLTQSDPQPVPLGRIGLGLPTTERETKRRKVPHTSIFTWSRLEAALRIARRVLALRWIGATNCLTLATAQSLTTQRSACVSKRLKNVLPRMLTLALSFFHERQISITSPWRGRTAVSLNRC